MTLLRRRSHRAAAGLLATALVLGACGTDESGGGDERGDQPAEQRAFEEELEELAGVDDARVDREAFDTEYYGEEIVVDMVPDATAAEVAAVLDALAGRGDEHGPQEALVTLGAGDTDTAPDWYDADAPPFVVPADSERRNAAMAELLVAAAAALPDHAVLVTSSEWSVFLDSEEPDPRPAMDAVLTTLREDDALADAGEVNVTVNTVQKDNGVLRYTGDLSDRSIALWEDVASVMDKEIVNHVSLYDPLGIDVGVALEDVKPRELTTEEYGDLLWPVVRHEIDVLATLEDGAQLSVTNYSGPGGDTWPDDKFVTVTLGKQASSRDRHERTWNAEAWAYLDR